MKNLFDLYVSSRKFYKIFLIISQFKILFYLLSLYLKKELLHIYKIELSLILITQFTTWT